MRFWRHHHHGRHHPRGRVHHALLLGIQRKIFVAFGVTIVLTGCVLAGMMQILSPGGGWRHDIERARRFASRQLAAVWDEPLRRHALVEGIASDLEVGITLYGVAGEQLESAGGACQRKAIQVRVFNPKTGVRLGRAEVCPTGALLPQTGRFLLGFGVALMAMWAASGVVAYKLAKPLVAVAEVAREIGRGRLQSRERLARGHHDEAGIVADALHEAAARIDKQLADQRALLAAVSHEIRTPLARMRLLVELALTSPDKLAELDREIVELDVLVADLLAGARVDFSALKPVTIDGRKLATDVLARENLDADKVDVEGDVLIEGDATLLARAVANLVQNAIKYAGGIDRLRVARRNDHVAFEVLDRGPGLLPGEETKVFEPFYRRADTGEAAKAGAMSVGLGLSLVRRIAEAHGGTAFAESREGGGARIGFEVRA